MAKMGRPVEVNPKCKKVTVRFTEAEYDKLQDYTNMHDQTLSQTIKVAVDALCDGKLQQAIGEK